MRVERDLELERLLEQIRACAICSGALPLGPRPVLQAGAGARVLIAGQAPGRRVHATGIPFNDPSGDRLREWLEMDREVFYDASRVALAPMGFCYPGTGRSGDLPPRPECAATWREALLSRLRDVRLVVPVGSYAIRWHLGDRMKGTLAETVRAWREYGEGILPLPHPSPRNNRWLRLNPWFEAEVVPELRRRVRQVMGRDLK